MTTFEERILCAAIHYSDEPMKSATNVEGLVLKGRRHHEIIAEYKFLRGKPTRLPLHVQGFLTTTGRFVDRAEAARIAHQTGQIDCIKDRLFSEDIY